jgi:hypothetical protein
VSAVNRPLCFVLMPFGRKADAAARVIDFDRVYRDLIAPAITAADMDPLRADEEMTGGIIHKPMFERLTLRTRTCSTSSDCATRCARGARC